MIHWGAAVSPGLALLMELSMNVTRSARDWAIMLSIFSTLSAGCQPSDDGETSQVSDDAWQADVQVEPELPTVVHVSWTDADAVATRVEYGLDGAWDLATPELDSTGGEITRTVLGLKAGHTYDLRAVSIDADGVERVGEDQQVTLDPPPESMTRITISDYDPDHAAPGGYVLTTLMEATEAWVVILDRDGDVVWYRRVDDGLGSVSPRFDPARASVIWDQYDLAEKSDLSGIMRMALDGSEQVATRAFQGHHDFAILPDGRYGFPSVATATVDVDGEMTYVAADRILEVDEGAGEGDGYTEIFSLFDHYDPMWVPCSHFEEEVYGTGAKDFSHSNSLVWLEDRDAYALMSKNLDNLLIVDRATGEVEHEIGGRYADISTDDTADMWSHGHYSQIWEGGFTVFDNAYHRDVNASRALEYQLDLDAGTMSLAWAYKSEGGRFNSLLGDVKRLGTTHLVSWTEFGMLTEVGDDGSVVWRAETEVGTGFGRATWVADLYDPIAPGDF